MLICVQVMSSIPRDQRTRVAHFLEKQGFKQQALVVSTDPDHRFDLAISLDKVRASRCCVRGLSWDAA